MANLTLEIDGKSPTSNAQLADISAAILSVAAGEGDFFVVTDVNADHTFAQTGCWGNPAALWPFNHFDRGVGYERLVTQDELLALFEGWIGRGPDWGTDDNWECLGDFS